MVYKRCQELGVNNEECLALGPERASHGLWSEVPQTGWPTHQKFLVSAWRLEVQVKVLAELIPSEGLFSLCAYMVILCPSLCPGFLLHGHHQMGSGSNHPSEGI